LIIEKLRAIIIDDEAGAREVLENLLLRFCPNIELVAQANGLVRGVEVIKKFEPDVVFIDIQMPLYAGYEIVSLIDEINFSIIFVTAYDQYALKAFEISALDYLLKPIDIDRLKSAVSKLEDVASNKIAQEQYALLNDTIKTHKASKIAFFEKGERCFLKIEDIIALEGQSSYCQVHLKDGTSKVLSKNLKTTYSYLEDWDVFFRCHKSWVINTDYFKSLSKSNLEITLETSLKAKLSRNKMSELEALLQ
jgi:two-component system LytT family response regulator